MILIHFNLAGANLPVSNVESVKYHFGPMFGGGPSFIENYNMKKVSINKNSLKIQ